MDDVIRPSVSTATRADAPTYQAYQVLHWGFVAAPTLAGVDKFFNLMTDWQAYLAPAIERMLPISGHAFMLLVGAVEVIAGLLVALRPRIGAYVVAAWLGAIIINLVMHGRMLDIALRDLGLMFGAIALGRLATLFDRPRRAY